LSNFNIRKVYLRFDAFLANITLANIRFQETISLLFSVEYLSLLLSVEYLGEQIRQRDRCPVEESYEQRREDFDLKHRVTPIGSVQSRMKKRIKNVRMKI
jgi:hypothetical protein